MTPALLTALMGWAALLAHYPPPATLPSVQFVAPDRMSALACAGAPCSVLGWYPAGGGDVVFVDARLDPEQSTYAAGVVVHELVHYLQAHSARWPARATCEQTMAMEREAYAAQGEFMTRYGDYRPVGAAMHGAGCAR
jgi:hypothetical protein